MITIRSRGKVGPPPRSLVRVQHKLKNKSLCNRRGMSTRFSPYLVNSVEWLEGGAGASWRDIVPPHPYPDTSFIWVTCLPAPTPKGRADEAYPPRRKEEKEGVAAAGEDAAQPPAQSNYQIKLHFLVWCTLYTLHDPDLIPSRPFFIEK